MFDCPVCRLPMTHVFAHGHVCLRGCSNEPDFFSAKFSNDDVKGVTLWEEIVDLEEVEDAIFGKPKGKKATH